MEGNNDITKMVKEDVSKGWLGRLADDLSVVVDYKKSETNILDVADFCENVVKKGYNLLKNYLFKKGEK